MLHSKVKGIKTGVFAPILLYCRGSKLKFLGSLTAAISFNNKFKNTDSSTIFF